MYLLEHTADEEHGATTRDSWQLLAHQLTVRLSANGTWRRWGESSAAIAWPSSLTDACERWRSGDSVQGHQVVAALCREGSRRGHDDDDAALAVVLMLDPGVRRAASRLADVCDLDDVRAAVWETVKRAEPHLGPRAPMFILKRAQQRLVQPGAGFLKPHDERVSLELLVSEDLGELLTTDEQDASNAREELAELLDWALGSGVLNADQAAFIRELTLVAEAVSDDQATNEFGARRGISARTVRRHRAEVLTRLRQAVPAYLEATA